MYTYFINLTNYFIKVLSKLLFITILKLWEQTFRAESKNASAARKEFIFERKNFMKFKIVGKSLILTDYSYKITEGENSFDTVEITAPRYHDNCDLSTLSFRFSETSEDGELSAVQVLSHEKCDEKYIHLKGTITSDFSAITGKVTFMLTGVSSENIVAKFQSKPFTVSADISFVSLPNKTTAELLFNQAQLEVQKAIYAAERAEIASQTPAPAEIYPATATKLGGILSGNDISVSDIGTVTVNSVNGKTLGKSVPANAVFTDTVYTLPKATTGTLGGIKIDGTTITASNDGTISASEVQNLAVQIAHPNNFLIYDNAGKPSVMVAIPKFYLDEVIDGANHTVHPAFIINGVEQDVIYISKYQNIVTDGKAYSLPMKDPTVNIDFDTAWNYCKAKGDGWHLMTNAEWAAIALWCKKNNTLPKGNNNFGKDINEIEIPQKATATFWGNDGKIGRVATGSGRESWYHDGTFAGVADLNGNIWEWNSGVRLFNGEIQILENNDAADWNNSVSPTSALWKAILPSGLLVSPGTSGTLKWDYTTTPTASTENIQLNTVIEHRQETEAPQGYALFKSLTVKNGINVPIILKALGLYPDHSSEFEKDKFWFKNIGERMSVHGGYWSYASDAGAFALGLNFQRKGLGTYIGFRSAYYKKG